MSKNPNSLWHELKRRKVLRVITVYAAAAFVILEAVDIVLPRIGLPDWTVTVVIILLAFGFIVAAALAWVFDITPMGIKKTQPVYPEQTNQTFRESDHQDWILETAVTTASSDVTIQKDVYILEQRDKKKGRVYGFSSIIIIAISGVLFLFYSGRSVPFYERDWIIISDFENTTGEVLFDKCLNTAFFTSIAQSQYVNVFSRQRIYETLARMQIENPPQIDREMAQEVAIREGIRIFLDPTVSKIGDKYVLSCNLIESGSGDLLRSEIVYAENQSEILESLDKLSLKIRRSLGETRYQIIGQKKPLAMVTTHSLEALRQFSLGIEHHLAGDFTGARKFYESALQIDSTFTSAKASLGNLMYERFDQETGTKLLQQVIESVDDLTDKEKYGILAFYAVSVEKDINKGIEYTKMLIEMYPDDPVYLNNLGWYYQYSERYEEALAQYKAAVTINPHLVLTYAGIAYVYNEFFGRYDSAYVWSKRMIADNPGNAWGYMHLGTSLLCYDSLVQSVQAFEKAREISPDLTVNLFRLAHVYRVMGKYDDAIQALEQILLINQSETAAHYDLGVNYHLAGQESQSREHFQKFKSIAEEFWIQYWPENVNTYIALSAVSYRLGDTASGLKMRTVAMEKDSSAYVELAELYAIQGYNDTALVYLKSALDHGYRKIYWLWMHPDLQPLHTEPRFRQLLESYGI